MKHFFLCSLLALGSLTSSVAQHQARNWFFGERAGLYFPPSAASPTVLTSGMLNTREGCTAISDSAGNLLLYSDGQSVYNAQHQVLAQGTGLMGNPSSTQAALLLPRPATPGRYYLFTSDIPSSGNGIRYSEIDVPGNRVDTVTKNTPLLIGNTITERLAATRHANGTAYWVLAHDVNDGFFAFVVTAIGTLAAPVQTNVGSVHNTQYGGIGYLKFSPTGTRVAVAISGTQKRVEVFDFDRSTGIVSGPTAVIDSISAAYGVEFSPDEHYLYVTGLLRSGSGFSGQSQLAQYDLQAGSMTAINQSRYVLATSATESYGALQLAPNGHILVAKETAGFGSLPSLDVIQQPDSGTAGCDYVPNGLLLDIAGVPHRTRIGLPNFESSLFKPLVITGVAAAPAQPAPFRAQIQPNPASGTLCYALSGLQPDQPVQLQLFDLTGRLVQQQVLPASARGRAVISDLAGGLYVAAFTANGSTVYQRVLLE